MKTSICYFTSRLEPHFNWFVDSLANEIPIGERSDVQLVIVDRHLWALTPEAGNNYFARGDLISLTDPQYQREDRKHKIGSAVQGRFEFIHLPVKPCAWQGPFRFTSKDWFCAASARNTAIMAAKHPYFVGVDDLSVLISGWWPQVKHAAESGYCVCGAYKKVKDLVVDNGNLVSFTEYPAGVDSRWGRGSPDGIVPWSGSELYGCSFGMPVELLLKVNGCEELCDGLGAEDYDLGMRVERAGGKFFYNRNMVTYESEEMHYLDPALPRESKIVLQENLPADYHGRRESDHVMLNRVAGEARITTLSTHNLRQARDEFQASQRAMIPIGPLEDWRDGTPLGDL